MSTTTPPPERRPADAADTCLAIQRAARPLRTLVGELDRTTIHDPHPERCGDVARFAAAQHRALADIQGRTTTSELEELVVTARTYLAALNALALYGPDPATDSRALATGSYIDAAMWLALLLDRLADDDEMDRLEKAEWGRPPAPAPAGRVASVVEAHLDTFWHHVRVLRDLAEGTDRTRGTSRHADPCLVDALVLSCQNLYREYETFDAAIRAAVSPLADATGGGR